MSSATHNAKAPKAWLELVRAPNLLTVPGDPLAGFLLAGGADWKRAVPAMMASLLAYAAGLIDNDLADLDTDRKERPDRPLPRGAVPVKSAKELRALLFGGSFIFASLAGVRAAVVMLTLFAVIKLYNHKLKQDRLAGSAAMGLCRGLSLAIGAAAAAPYTWFSLWPAMLAWTLYIGSVTFMAARETRPEPFTIARWIPALTAPLLLLLARWPWTLPGLLLWALFCFMAGLQAMRWPTRPQPDQVSYGIGSWIGNLLYGQAALCACAPPVGYFAAVLLLIVRPILTSFRKSFQ